MTLRLVGYHLMRRLSRSRWTLFLDNINFLFYSIRHAMDRAGIASYDWSSPRRVAERRRVFLWYHHARDRKPSGSFLVGTRDWTITKRCVFIGFFDIRNTTTMLTRIFVNYVLHLKSKCIIADLPRNSNEVIHIILRARFKKFVW